MPKDWSAYRSEVQRMYMVEEKTVHQVREILRSKHGFNASVRAYRTKFDEWGLRKYRSRKRHSHPPGAAQAPPEQVPENMSSNFRSPLSLSSNTMSEHVDNDTNHPTTVTEVLPVPALLNLINVGMYDSLSVLETLIFHWQPGSEYNSTLLSYFQDPEFNKWVARYPGPATPAVFKLIEDCVPEDEQFRLTKSMLEADLSCKHDANHYYTPWQEAWHHACDAEEWEEAKELLYEDGVLSVGAGVFLDCAPVVIAERLLSKYSNQLGHWTYKTLNALELDAKRECSERYREILSDFRHSKVDVSPEFYKFLLQTDLNEESDSVHDCRRWAEYRQKYLQLQTLQPKTVKETNLTLDYLLMFGTPQVPRTSGQILDDDASASPSPSLSSSRVLSQPAQTQTPFVSHINTRKAAEILKRKWTSLSGFEEYAHSVLMRDGSTILVFEPLRPECENLFDGILAIMPEPDQVSFTKSLLVAFSTAIGKCSNPSWILAWWCSSYPLANWDKFQQLLMNQELATKLEQTMSLVAAKLFTDSAISLVGEKLLGNLKNGMVAARRRESAVSSVGAFRDHSKRQQRYMAILGEFQKRGMKVDQSWISYLLNIM